MPAIPTRLPWEPYAYRIIKDAGNLYKAEFRYQHTNGVFRLVLNLLDKDTGEVKSSDCRDYPVVDGNVREAQDRMEASIATLLDLFKTEEKAVG